MVERVLVKVIGFSDVERHALNTVFRLSEQGQVAYSPWMEEAPQDPQLLLVDGESYEAALELAAPAHAGLQLIWIGPAAPEDASLSFERPLAWPQIVRSMDALFSPASSLDFDLDAGAELDVDLEVAPDEMGGDTQPPEPLPPFKRALIASADRDQRLYLRARLALANLTQADEAETGPQALEMVRSQHYDVALIDFAVPGGDGWSLLKALREARPAIAHLIVTKSRPTAGERVRAWFQGMAGFFGQRPDPEKLGALLQKV